MKVAYKMFNYGNNTYRFVSKEPLEVGDTIKINDIGINGNFFQNNKGCRIKARLWRLG